MGIASAVLLLAGCNDAYEATEACVDKTRNPPIVSDWKNCERDPSRFGSYSWQLPNSQYDDDGYVIYNGFTQPPVGSPARGGSFGPPKVSSPAKVARPAAGSTISRGGLGVVGSGSSSGS